MNVLIIGSAPYAPTWWNERLSSYTGHELVTLNNAWSLVFPYPQTWWHSADFDIFGHVKPSGHAGLTEKVVGVDDLREPFGYDTPLNGTVFLNVAYHYLNIAVASDLPLMVDVAGCDFVYSPNSHFYGQGTADPLRFGEEWLADRLGELWSAYRSTGRIIRNVGGSVRSLLPTY